MNDEPLDMDGLLAVYNAARADARSSSSTEYELPTPLVDWTTAYGEGEDGARWLAEPLLPEGGAVALFAKGGTGKSLLALWIAAGLATGTGLAGDHEPEHVLYLDYEMRVSDVVERLEDMGYDKPADLWRLHYAALPTLPPLDTLEGGRAVLELARHTYARVVVVDTFGRAVDGEEDRADTVRAWYRWTGQPLKSEGVAFLRVDHAGKDTKRGQRGTSAKNDDVDVVWEMTDRGRGSFLLTATKRRVSWVPERVALEQTAENGVLSYRWTDHRTTYRAGTLEVAELLEALGAPADLSRRKALTLLRSAGHGRDTNVVADACRYRRAQLPGQTGADHLRAHSDLPGPPSQTTTADHPADHLELEGETADKTTASLQVIPPADHRRPPPAPKPGEEDTHVVCASPEVDEPRVVGLFEDLEDEELEP